MNVRGAQRYHLTCMHGLVPSTIAPYAVLRHIMQTRILLVLSALSFFACIAAEAQSTAAETGARPAETDTSQTVAWTRRELRVGLPYYTAAFGLYGYRDCEYLGNDLRWMLLELGARESDLDINLHDCSSRPVLAGKQFVVVAEIKFSVVAPTGTTGSDAAASAPIQGHWQTVEMAMDERPRQEVLTDTRLNRYMGLGPRSRTRVWLLKTQLLPLFTTRGADINKDASVLHAQVLKPLDDPAAGR